MILLIDNYDSFSYNLVQLAGGIDPDIRAVRNDAMTVEEIRQLHPDRIILSPGPGYPKDAGICEAVVRELAGTVPILGVCLGHQAICEAFGGKIVHAKKLMHGKQSRVRIDPDSPIFSGLPEEIDVARYHSLVAKSDEIPEALQVIGVSQEGEVMAVAHRSFPLYGLQFHPESILTKDGETIMRNFLSASLA